MSIFLRTNGQTQKAEIRLLDERHLESFLALYRAAAPDAVTAGRFLHCPERAFRALLLGGEMLALCCGDIPAAAAGWYLPAAARQEDILRRAAPPDAACMTGCFVHPQYAAQQPQRHLVRACCRRALSQAGHSSLTAYARLRDTARAAMLLEEGFLLSGYDQACCCLPRYRFTKSALQPAAADISFCIPFADSYAVTRALADGAAGYALAKRQGETVLWCSSTKGP